MKIDLKQPILNFDGEPIQDNGKEITYGQIIRNLLGSPSKNDDGDKKLKKFDLGLKCVADTPDLDLDERKLIKDVADEAGISPLLYGRICQLMEAEQENT